MKKWLLFIPLLLVSGCTTMGQPYSPPPPAPEGKSIVYLMRSSVGYGGAWSTVFSINDTKVVSLYDKGYTWVHVGPGQYKFSAGTTLNSDYLKFVAPVRSGQEYFIEYTQESLGYPRYRNVIRGVSPGVGKSTVEKYSYIEADKVDIPTAPKE
jgi:hypothetical protein